MRILILSAFLAYAAAAPSGWDVALGGRIVPIVPIVHSGPLISTGDIQAAAIDAKVAADNARILAEDEARAALDKQNEKIAEQGTENLSAKAISTDDLIKENNAQVLQALEDKKWQALDALKTVEAQIDGKIASISPILAKNAVGGLYNPYLPVITAPLVYPARGLIAPGVNTISTQSQVQSQDDSVQVEAKTSEAMAKTTVPEAPVNTATAEAEKFEAAVKSAALEAEKPAGAEKSEKVEKVDAVPLVAGYPTFRSIPWVISQPHGVPLIYTRFY